MLYALELVKKPGVKYENATKSAIVFGIFNANIKYLNKEEIHFHTYYIQNFDKSPYVSQTCLKWSITQIFILKEERRYIT